MRKYIILSVLLTFPFVFGPGCGKTSQEIEDMIHDGADLLGDLIDVTMCPMTQNYNDNFTVKAKYGTLLVFPISAFGGGQLRAAVVSSNKNTALTKALISKYQFRYPAPNGGPYWMVKIRYLDNEDIDIGFWYASKGDNYNSVENTFKTKLTLKPNTNNSTTYNSSNHYVAVKNSIAIDPCYQLAYKANLIKSTTIPPLVVGNKWSDKSGKIVKPITFHPSVYDIVDEKNNRLEVKNSNVTYQVSANLTDKDIYDIHYAYHTKPPVQSVSLTQSTTSDKTLNILVDNTLIQTLSIEASDITFKSTPLQFNEQNLAFSCIDIFDRFNRAIDDWAGGIINGGKKGCGAACAVKVCGEESGTCFDDFMACKESGDQNQCEYDTCMGKGGGSMCTGDGEDYRMDYDKFEYNLSNQTFGTVLSNVPIDSALNIQFIQDLKVNNLSLTIDPNVSSQNVDFQQCIEYSN